MVRSRERTVANERRRIDRRDQMEFLHRREQEVVRIEDMAKQQVADTELKASKNSGKTVIIEQANYKFHLCEANQKVLYKI